MIYFWCILGGHEVWKRSHMFFLCSFWPSIAAAKFSITSKVDQVCVNPMVMFCQNLIFITLLSGPGMSKIAEIRFWLSCLEGSNLVLCQKVAVKTIRYLKSKVKTKFAMIGCFQSIILSSGSKLALKNVYFQYEISFLD